MPDPALDSEILFGRLVVEHGLAKPEQVEECRRLQSQLAQAGIAPIPKLGELLIKKGYLTSGQLDRTLRMFGLGSSGASPHSPILSRESELPPEAAGGERMGKYVKTKKLGAGGMGEVWKGWDTELRRWVALKFLKGSDAEEVARFRREAQTAAKLTHPHIGAVYEARDEFIAMQFVDGQTLETVPRDDPRMLAEVARQAALAVQFAHEQGVIHRDLKPANIMVTGAQKAPTTRRLPGLRRAPNVQAYVMDFGLAKSTALDSKLSVSGLILGTPSYMSPEQARGSSRLDARSDIYSLGATLYELLANRPPFRDDNVYELLKKVIEEDARPLEGDLGTIAMKCLEKEPDRRYATAQELADDLGRFLAGDAILAHPPSMLYKLRKFVGRRRAVVGVAVAGVASMAILTTLFVPRWIHERSARQQAQRQMAEEEARAKDREAAIEIYKAAERELHALRLRSYRRDWTLTDDELGKIDSEIEKCRRQMEKTGPSADGWWIIGRSKDVLGEWEGAIEAYDQGLRLRAGDGACLLYKARLLLDRALAERFAGPAGPSTARSPQERTSEAVALLGEGIASGRVEGIELDLARGYELVVQGRPAEEYCEAMLEKWKGKDFREEFYLIRGLASTRRLIEDASEALVARPGFFEAYLWRGLRRMETHDETAALTDFEKAIAINPRFSQAWLERGSARGARKDFRGMIEDCSKAIEIEPKSARAHYNRGVARKEAGDPDGAIGDYDRAIDLDPKFAAAYAARANSYRLKGSFDRAVADCDKALSICPKWGHAFLMRGVVRKDKGDVKGAIADYNQSILLDPKSAEAYHNRGVARKDQGDLDGAIADYDQAIGLNPQRALTYFLRGLARAARGNLEGAIADYGKAIEINPKDSMVYANRGLARHMKGDVDGATADYDKAIELNARLAETYANRGLARHSKGDRAGAIADFDKAIELNPKLVAAYSGRSLSRAAEGDLDGGLKDCDKAIELDPRDAAAYGNRALVRRAKGDFDGAIADFETALRVAPPGWPHRARIEQLLAKAKADRSK